MVWQGIELLYVGSAVTEDTARVETMMEAATKKRMMANEVSVKLR